MAAPMPGRSAASVAEGEGGTRIPLSALLGGAGDRQSTTIHIDAKTGHTYRENSDGTLTVGAAAEKPEQRPSGKFDENLAAREDVKAVLNSIAARLLESIESDIQSRADWEETAARGADLLGVKLEQASAEVGVDGTISRVKDVGLKSACLNSWANSRAELLPVNGPVKVRDDSDTEEEEEDEALARLGHNGGPPLDDATPPAEPADTSNVIPMPGMADAAPPAADPGSEAGITAAAATPAPPPQPLQPGQMGKTELRNRLAEGFERDFNHYLTVIDRDYYPDTSRMLMSRALLGCQFKKVYRDPILKRGVSRWVKGTNLIVSNDATSLSGAARITERIPMRQSVVKRYQKTGFWLDVTLVTPTTEVSTMDRKIAETEGIKTTQLRPEDQLHTIFECYCELDDGPLANNEKGKEVGWPLPYRVTIDKDSRQILEIRRNWRKGDDQYIARRRYVKFGHVPSLGFYDWGFVHLIGDCQRGATMIERCLIDCGMLASYPGGIMGKSPSTRQRTTQIRPGLGEFIVIDTGNKDIKNFVTTWPYKEPSAVLQALGKDLQMQMAQVAGQVQLPVGEGRLGTTPVGTIMAYIDTVSKVPSAVHKDDHIAQQEEFELLQELFAEEPDTLTRGNKRPARKKWLRAEIMDQNLIPAADPNVPSQTHRLVQAQLLISIAGLVQFQGIANQRAVYEAALRVSGFSNTGEYTQPPTAPQPPPPDPRVVAAQIKSTSQGQSDQVKLKLATDKSAADVEKAKIESADKAADRDSDTERAAIKAHTEIGTHVSGIVADHAQHQDQMAHAGLELGQKHAQHLNELGQQQAEATQAAEAQPVPEPPAQGGQ